jgi:hypothetical protein
LKKKRATRRNICSNSRFTICKIISCKKTMIKMIKMIKMIMSVKTTKMTKTTKTTKMTKTAKTAKMTIRHLKLKRTRLIKWKTKNLEKKRKAKGTTCGMKSQMTKKKKNTKMSGIIEIR